MSTDIVTISNKSYSISQSISDRARRRKYFNTFKEDTNTQIGKLTSEESQLLSDLGMDAKMINTLKMYLPTFFDNLQSCSSDSGLILNKKCNIPYYVLWSIMLANKETTDQRLRENKLKTYTTPNIVVAMNTSMLHNFRPKEISDPYDQLFQLILTKTAAIPIPIEKESTNNFVRLFQLPSNNTSGLLGGEAPGGGGEASRIVEEVPGIEGGDNKEDPSNNYFRTIPEIFTLIVLKKKTSDFTPETVAAPKPTVSEDYPPVDWKKKVKEFSNRLQKLVRERSTPLYTFSQLGGGISNWSPHVAGTCASDSLFTILLQADGFKDIFINNIVSLYSDIVNGSYRFIANENQYYQKSIDSAMDAALHRYANMLELESKHIKEASSSRRRSINFGKQHGVTMLSSVGKGKYEALTCGLTRKDIIKYVLELKEKLIKVGIINVDSFNVFYGYNFKGNYWENLNTIKGFDLSISDHAIALVKIDNEWYLSDNNIMMLHKITDLRFILLLFYKLYNARIDTDDLCEVIKLTNVTDNLMYKFVFHMENGKTYSYPDLDTNNTTKLIQLTAGRTIVFTCKEQQRDALLDNLAPNLSISENEFATYIDSISETTVMSENGAS